MRMTSGTSTKRHVMIHVVHDMYVINHRDCYNACARLDRVQMHVVHVVL